jgi:hypothetical protein
MDGYLRDNPADQNGIIKIEMKRVEVEAMK